MKALKAFYFIFFLLFSLNCTYAQSDKEKDYDKIDSLREIRQYERALKFKDLKPNKAAYLSIALPGAGQIYNRSYWKVPLVYGGLGAFAGIAYFNHEEYIRYKRAFNNRTDEFDETTVPQDLARLTDNALKANRNLTKKYRDLNIILGVLFYGLNVADAYVDAHLKGFEVGEDISMDIQPGIFMNGNNLAGGMTFTFNIK